MSDDHSVDFLKEKYNLAPSRHRAKRLKTTLRVVGITLGLFAIGGVVFSYNLAQEYQQDSAEYESFSFFSSFRSLVGSDEKDLTGEEDDRINFLLTGVGGAGHAGPELTDTIVFGSFQPSTSDIGMLSIPRDLAVPIPGYGYRKINHVNAYGELEEVGSGPEKTAELVGDLLDQAVHYYVKVDFNGFVDLIDAIGGIDVYVDQAFTDYSYPTDDYLVETISFDAGWQRMDGETALKFARSRHGTNGEGSDFARASRQQKIILAVKDRMLSASTFLNPSKLNRMIDTFQENVETNLTFWEVMKLVRYAPDIDIDNIHLSVLDSSYDSPLYSTNINGAYVLLPKRDDWSGVQDIAENIFESSSEPTAVVEASSVPSVSANIEIQNGTSTPGLAFTTSQLLLNSGFDVLEIGNADSKDYDKTIIYDLIEGEKADALAVLKEYFEADVAMSTSGWAFSDEVVPRELTIETPGEDQVTGEDIDFLIILGENASDLVLR